MRIMKEYVTSKVNIPHLREFSRAGFVQQLRCYLGSVILSKVFIDPLDQLQVHHAGGLSTTKRIRRASTTVMKRMVQRDGRVELLSAGATERLFKELERCLPKKIHPDWEKKREFQLGVHTQVSKGVDVAHHIRVEAQDYGFPPVVEGTGVVSSLKEHLHETMLHPV